MSMFPILAGYNAETYAVVLIIEHDIFQEGVYCVFGSSLFPPICYAVYPNMARGAVPTVLCVVAALAHRDHLHLLY